MKVKRTLLKFCVYFLLVLGICDFQFLPMMKVPDGRLEDISESLLPKRVDGDHLRQWLGSPASYFLPPAAFSRIDSQSLNVVSFYKYYFYYIIEFNECYF